ncbi:MAG: phospholipase D-like domain-containing protein [Thermoplasmata archaeon]|nr:phospholipase D-like domain-containing protein [Thermoplasmata archaeon]
MTYLTVPFFTFVFAVLPFWLPLFVVDLSVFLVMLFKERFDPRTFIFWIAIVVIVPFGGALMYLIWGCTLFIRRDGLRKAESDAPVMAAEQGPVPEEDARLAGILGGSGADVYTQGNSAELVWSSHAGTDRFYGDLLAAKESIHLETAAIFPGRVGVETPGILAQKAGEGLDVRILTSVSGFGRNSGLHRMKKAGARHATLHHRVHSMFSISTKNRNLRNIIVIDGRIAYTGMSTFLRIEGPAAARLGTRFLADWHHATGEDVAPVPDPEPVAGGCGMQMVSSGPDSPTSPMLHGYSAMISEAKERLYITFPYLVPTDEMYNAIKQAVISGTDVRILIPAKSRRWYQAWNSLAASNPLMEAGAHVYFASRSLVKCVVVADGRVCTVGSAVYNSRMWADYAENAVVYSEELARKAEEAFEAELEGAAECLPEEYTKRSVADRIAIGLARMMMFFNRCGRAYLYKHLLNSRHPQVFKWQTSKSL